MRIKCPTCSQQFEVAEDLMGKKVSCGACQAKFIVQGNALDKTKTKKSYPGEHRDDLLNRFNKTTTAAGQVSSFQQANQVADLKPLNVGPVSPIYLLAIFVAIGVFLTAFVLFLAGGSPDGFLHDLVQKKRFVLAGFCALLVFFLICYGSVRKRLMGAVIGFVAAGIISFLPILFPYVDPRERAGRASQNSSENVDQETVNQFESLQAIKDRVGYQPIQSAIERSIRSNIDKPEENVVGVYLKLLSEEYKIQILDYIKDEADLEFRPDFYVRGLDAKSWLMVIEGGVLSLSDVAKACEKFGRIEEVHENLRLIEIVVENSRLADANVDELTNSENINFYAANKKELEGIDKRRIKDAVVRLGNAQPKEYRAPIVSRMSRLMQTGSLEMRDEIAKAFMVWTVAEDDVAEEATIEAMKEIRAANGKVPETIIRYLVMRQREEVLDTLFAMWKKNPPDWEEQLVDYGPKIEKQVLEFTRDANPAVERSALRVIRRIGTSLSLQQLKLMEQSADGEILHLLRTALDSIRKRG